MTQGLTAVLNLKTRAPGPCLNFPDQSARNRGPEVLWGVSARRGRPFWGVRYGCLVRPTPGCLEGGPTERWGINVTAP